MSISTVQWVREYHNGIKLRALRRIWNERPSSIGTPTLLDVGCGRANDLHKWNALSIDEVIGVDPDWEQIAHAIERMNTIGAVGKVGFVQVPAGPIGFLKLGRPVGRGILLKSPQECGAPLRHEHHGCGKHVF